MFGMCRVHYLLTSFCWSPVCSRFNSFACAIGFLVLVCSSSYGQDTLSTDTIAIPDSLVLADEFDSPVKYKARDSVVYDLNSGMVFLYGEAFMEYEDIQLEADYIHLDTETKTLFASAWPDSSGVLRGAPKFKQGEDKFEAETIRYNFETKRGKITEVTTRDGESLIHGQSVRKEPDNSTFVSRGYFTTCDAPQPHYCLKSDKIKVIPNDKVVTGPADLFVMGVPTPVAIPFGFFPNVKGRSSGILFPQYGDSRQLGFFLKNGGYYLGLSDHFDLAITGDIYSKGSWRVNAFSNYNWRYRFSGNFSVNYSNTRTSRPEFPDYSLEKAFFVRWNHTQDSKARPGTSFTANVNAGSSTFYRFNLSNANNFLTNTFTSSVAWSKAWIGKPINLSVAATHTQNTQTGDISISLPSATFNLARQSPFKRKKQVGAIRWYERIGVGYTTSFINSITTKDSLLFSESSLSQFRNGIQHSVPINTNVTIGKFFTLTPSIAYSEKWYLRTIEKRWDADKALVEVDTVDAFKAAREFSFSASLNTRIYGLVQFKRGKIAALRHVMTPTLSYSFKPDFSDPALGYYKQVQVDTTGRMQQYSIFEGTIFGGPGVGKSSLVAFSLDNNLEMKLRKQTDTAEVMKKVKLFESLSLNTAYNFAADSLRLSPLSITGRTTLVDRVSLNMFGTIDPYVTTAQGTRINTLEWNQNGRIGRLTNANFSLNFSVTKRQQSKQDAQADERKNEMGKRPGDYFDPEVPFSLSFAYNVFYQNSALTGDEVTQTISMNGDVQLTPAWKVNYNTGYDFRSGEISYTSLGIYRDLHCWEMSLNWVPFGFQQNFFFQINVKSSMLQDLKLTRKNDRFDNR